MRNEELKNILELSGSIVNVYSNLSGSYLATISGDINKSYLFTTKKSEHIVYNISNANTNNDNKIDGTYYYKGIYEDNGFPYFQNDHGYTIFMTGNWGWTIASALGGRQRTNL